MGILDPGGKEKMGWVNGAGALNPDAIKGDLAGLESGTKSEFDGNIDKCAGWNGDFGSRRKREAGETETEEEASNVPSVMESGSSALGWLKAAVRKTRSAEPGNGDKKRKAQRKRKRGGKKVGKNGPKRGSRKNGNPKKGKGGKGSKRGKDEKVVKLVDVERERGKEEKVVKKLQLERKRGKVVKTGKGKEEKLVKGGEVEGKTTKEETVAKRTIKILKGKERKERMEEMEPEGKRDEITREVEML